ncbi:MAG: 3'(2'),5'-bisphosphate nucleotidase CysQ family protein [Weeksellaceae bacterium]
MEFKSLLSTAVQATIIAGTEIMDQYVNGFDTIIKEDGSPVTTADLKAHEILNEHLNKTGIAVMSEEGEKFTHEFRQNNAYWCLDPIDGTKDYVHKTGEFCISVGLISENTSKLGVLYAPALGLLYFAAESVGSFKFSGGVKEAESLLNHENFWDELLKLSNPLPTLESPAIYTFLTSRYHRDADTDAYIKSLQSEHPDLKVITMGCAIKLGIVADKNASEYTRYVSVNFWDIAGGHAVAKYAGLDVLKPNTTQEIDYTDPDMRVNGYSLKW